MFLESLSRGWAFFFPGILSAIRTGEAIDGVPVFVGKVLDWHDVCNPAKIGPLNSIFFCHPSTQTHSYV